MVCFNDGNYLVNFDRSTAFDSWINFYFFATSKSKTDQIAEYNHFPFQRTACGQKVSRIEEQKTTMYDIICFLF